MIHARKTAAIASVAACIALTMSVRSQESQGPRPVPEATRKGQARAEGSQDPFVAPPGLSEEAIRSFREIPPGVSSIDNAEPGEERNPSEASPPPDAAAPPSASRATPAKPQPRPEYVVEPPDVLLVEVLEALPGRPISGERLVRPDGRISLGFYGEIPVAGLTLPQIKERIVLHLRKSINDDILGLLEYDPETGRVKRDPGGQVHIKDPRETDRVFVDITAYNSQHCYILGEVAYPGSLPYTGGDTVLDLLQYAGGLLPSADRARIRLIRSFPKGTPARVLPIDYQEIAMGTDASTNYAILPGDRLAVPCTAPSRAEGTADRDSSPAPGPDRDVQATRTSGARVNPVVEGNPYFDRNGYNSRRNPGDELEQRIADLEAKLDRVIAALERIQPRDAADSGVIPPPAGSVVPEAMETPSVRGMEGPEDPSASRLRPRPRRVGPSGPRSPSPRRPRREGAGESPASSIPTRPRATESPVPPPDEASPGPAGDR